MEINFNISNLDITYTRPKNRILKDSINYLEAIFNFEGEIWEKDNVIKTVIFKNKDACLTVILNGDRCYIPYEVLKSTGFFVGVQASYTENGIDKTVYTRSCVVYTGESCCEETYNNQITPSQYEQLIGYINNLDFTEHAIENVKVNGEELLKTNKTVDIPIPTKTSDLVNDSGYEKTIKFKDVFVDKNDFALDAMFEDYPYKATLTCNGVTANDYASVVFSNADVISMNYAPICSTGLNTISIYSIEMPLNHITIPLIEVIKE